MKGPFPVLPTKNLDAGVAFYRSVMGMHLVKQDDQVALLERDGYRLMLSLSEDPPANHSVAGWSVDKIFDRVAKMQEAGVRFKDFGMENMNGVVDLDGDLVTWFQDPSGNLLSLTQWNQ